MRLALSVATLALITLPAFAQQPRGAAPARPPAQAQPQQPPAPPPGFFPCRTEGEICYIGVVSGPSQVLVLFTNNQQAEGIDAKPVELSAGEQPGQPLDLGQSLGRVVMLTGVFDPKTGLNRAEVVDTAGPLLTFQIKAQLTGEEPAQAASPQGGKPSEGKPPARKR